jgi:DNA polymerase-3 subunit delta
MELSFKTLDDYLQDLRRDIDQKADSASTASAPVTLIYGEEWLVETAFNKLLDVRMPPRRRSLNYEPLEGTSENIVDAIEKVNTYALLSGPKVVALLDVRLFDSGKDAATILQTARQAHASGNLRRAVTLFQRFLAVTEMQLDDFAQPDWPTKLAAHKEDIEDGQWLQEILAHCRSGASTASAKPADAAAALQAAIEKGFPVGNHLILTAHTIDKRRSVFQTIRRVGVSIDCTVPRGERRADKKNQQELLREMAAKRLTEDSKAIEPGAFEALCEKTGFELRNFLNNLEKLITYVGHRSRITAEDVESLLQRTKKDPVFVFTNAVTEKQTADALFFMHSLLADGLRPEQILVAVLNQMRKLLLIKEFVLGTAGKSWYADCAYGTFKSLVMPAVVEHDAQWTQRMIQWGNPADPAQGKGNQDGPKRSSKKREPSTDLVIAKNPANSFPVYQLFKKSERFSRQGLLEAFEHLTAADMRIKSGSEDKTLVLEDLVIKICSQAG